MFSMRWICFTYYVLIFFASYISSDFIPAKEFSRYTFVKPIMYHGREKREISSTKVNSAHIEKLSIKINLNGKERILNLKLNRDLISDTYFEKHQKNGTYVVRKPSAEDVNLCHYQGNVQGIANSWLAISTCDGIRGVIHDGQVTHYIEKADVTMDTQLNSHVLYSHSDLISNTTCGVSSKSAQMRSPNDLIPAKLRHKRSTSEIHGPYNANRLSRYIELLLVADQKEYISLNRNVSKVYQRFKDIANIINSLYTPLNIFVALIGVIVWTEVDGIRLEVDGDTTLNNFLAYRKERLVKDHPNDNAQLITKLQFEKGVVGKALKGPICTVNFSGGVNVDHSHTLGLVATTIAHEMGHNLGMEHDTSDCKCPSERCIMSESSSSESPKEWSSCSENYLTVSFEHGMDYCLRNKPKSLFDSPVCGNGFVEPGEQCDCGLKDDCNDACCDASTCMLFANASCATGKCCDLQTCKPQPAGTVCRSADHECDLPEYCTGQSEYCPSDVFKNDGETCNSDMAYCYQGSCRSHSDQCKILWGPSGNSSDDGCYNQNNIKGTVYGNCGYDRLSQKYISCAEEDVMCGMLQCRHYNEKLEFGMESVSQLSQSFIRSADNLVPCRTAIIDLGLSDVDPGLTPDGAKCGDNKMCLNQKCQSIEWLRTTKKLSVCSNNCYGNGICNSKGRCHCNDGYSPPFCEFSGSGGSEDSGPASATYGNSITKTLFYLMIMTLVPLVLGLFAYSYYIRRNPSYFWKRNARRTLQCEKVVQVRKDPCDERDRTTGAQSLLTSVAKPQIVSPPMNGLVGHFKGFSIAPIAGSSPIPVAAVKPIRAAPRSPVPIAAPKPSISSPILDGTTSSTVKELIEKEVKRPAPPVPVFKCPPCTPAVSLPPSSTLSTVSTQTTDHAAVTPRRNPSLKAAKIDREKLKNLHISYPIPIQEPPCATTALPVDNPQRPISRAHSLRPAQRVDCRAGIPAFGSVRVARHRRPPSVGSRPTSPPPSPPIGLPGYQAPAPTSAPYDDCANRTADDNIYAVIEECTATDEPIIDGGDGLLNEIVKEMQARRVDSLPTADANADSTSSMTSGGYLQPLPAEKMSTPPLLAPKLQVPETWAPSSKPFSTAKRSPVPPPLCNADKSSNVESSQGVKPSLSAKQPVISKINAGKATAYNNVKPKINTNLDKRTSNVASIQRRFEEQANQSSKFRGKH